MLKVVRATKNDLDAVLSLYAQENWLQEKDLVPAIFDALPPTCYILVAKDVDSGMIWGTAQLDIIQSLAFGKRPYGVVEFVVTDKNHRRQGIASAIFTEIDNICKKHECESVMLTSSAHRAEAHAFYEKMGYSAPVKGFRKEY